MTSALCAGEHPHSTCVPATRRCITFGAPRVGNFAFVDAFKWLVGLSYRCVYERDAVVDKPRSAFLTSFHGESTLSGADLRRLRSVCRIIRHAAMGHEILRR